MSSSRLSVLNAENETWPVLTDAGEGLVAIADEILTGELIDAHDAHRIGLVNEVVPATELIGRCAAILKHIDANAPLAVRYSIDAVNEGMDTDLTSGLKVEAKHFALAAGTEDKKEGTSAFVQKRAPQFRGK
jgi:enoyl-CoA hydratase